MRAARRRCAPPCNAAARRPASWPRLRCCAHTAAAGPRQRASGPATGASAAARGAAPSLTTVAVGISGGVDSAVAATLVHKAIGDRLHCCFVDNGLLRYKEQERVMKMFKDHLHLPVTCIDDSAASYASMTGTSLKAT